MIDITTEQVSIIVIAILVHLFVDWFLQNDWQANNKMKFVRLGKLPLPHPAGLLHAWLHTFFLWIVILPWWAAFTVGVLHYIIDCRTPLIAWRILFNQTRDPSNPASMHVAIWQDQVAHFLIIAFVVPFV